MIDLSDRPGIGWNALAVVSIIGIGVAIWFGFVSPVRLVSQADSSQRKELTASTIRARAKKDDDLDAMRAQVWNVSPEAMGSTVLDFLSGLSQKTSVQLTGFRTDKTQEVANLTEAPFVVVVEGGFLDVLAFTKKLEDPKSKLAVNMMQLSASDSGPGRVTLTLGLLGFLAKEVN